MIGHLKTAALAAMVVCAPSAVAAASKTIDAEPFTEIEVSSGITATIAIGDTQSVLAEAPSAGELDELIVEVKGGKLRAYFDWSVFDVFALNTRRDVELTIVVPEVQAISASAGAAVSAAEISGDRLTLEASSGANLSVSGIAVTRLSVEASSGAQLDADGTCDDAQVEGSSGAQIDADALICRSVIAEASSGAGVDVSASEVLEAEASSGAGIDVSGSPTSVKSEQSSGGEVRIR